MTIISADRKTDVYRFQMTFLVSANRLATEWEKAKPFESAVKYFSLYG